MFFAIGAGCECNTGNMPYAIIADCMIGIALLVITILAHKKILMLTQNQLYATSALLGGYVFVPLLFAVGLLSNVIQRKCNP